MKVLSFFFLVIISFFVILLTLIPVLATEGSIGVTPKSIHVDGILAGTTHVSRFKVTSTGFDTMAEIKGPISGWLHAEKTVLGYDVRIVVPINASPGMYAATIQVRADTDGAAMLTTKLALPVMVYVNVSDNEIVRPALKRAKIDLSENKVDFELDIENQGNVPVRILRANFTVFDAKGKVVGIGMMANDTPISEFSRGVLLLRSDFHAEPASYDAVLEVDIEGHVFKKIIAFDMPVLPLHLRILNFLKGGMR
jgi:hypothetical protein